jgi:hypothetical protein
MSVASALENVRRQRPVDLARVAVMVCPPTRLWRCYADRWLPDALLRLTGWRSDFLRTMVTERFVTCESYWREHGRPVAEAIQVMSAMRCRVRRDSTFREFTRWAASGRFDVLFLIVHHIMREDVAEFADGPRSFDQVRGAGGRGPGALMLFMCESAEWRDAIVAKSNHATVTGGAAWRMPFRHSTLFLLYWLRELDGKHTLEQARDGAIRAFEARQNDEVPHV